MIKKLINYLRVKQAVRTADKFSKLTRKRHYVIKIFGKIRVYNRLHIDYLITSGLLHKKLRNALELQSISIYFTK